MANLAISAAAWGIALAIMALLVKVIIWGLAAANLVVLPFFPTFCVVVALKILFFGRRG